MRSTASLPAARATIVYLGTLLLAASVPLAAQTAPDPPAAPAAPATAAPTPAAPEPPAIPASVQPILDFRASDVKFSLSELMSLLRDRRHEGWVLAAYPDPKTGRPLIGAGFSLDLPEREHPQPDPLNPHTFIEPSSAQLWQAAGLDPARLDQVIDQFNDNLALWRTQRYRRRIGSLAPQITDDEASSLLRVSAIQAIENARAYCRNFDRLTGPQQMAVSQLVYQMGVNLSEFGQFLSLINNDPARASALADPSTDAGAAPAQEVPAADGEHWRDVQLSLMQSQWARLYRVRATAVIAMLDPRYLDDPARSEARIAAVLRPVRHRRTRSRTALRTASYQRRSGHLVARKSSRAHARRKV
jgi:hypothetical protein